MNNLWLSHRQLLRWPSGALVGPSLHAGQPQAQTQEGDRQMKRMHVHVAVDDLDTAIGFYSMLFAARPSVVKPDYAKWMLDDPRVNFAISMRGQKAGLNHLGIQVESEGELAEVYDRLKKLADRCWRRARPPAATRSRKNRGSMIRRA
jgi:hypothetical protein